MDKDVRPEDLQDVAVDVSEGAETTPAETAAAGSGEVPGENQATPDNVNAGAEQSEADATGDNPVRPAEDGPEILNTPGTTRKGEPGDEAYTSNADPSLRRAPIRNTGEDGSKDNEERRLSSAHIFVPFLVKDEAAFTQLKKDLIDSPDWLSVTNDIRYLFRYVTEKLNYLDPAQSRTAHFRLSKEALERRRLTRRDRFFCCRTIRSNDTHMNRTPIGAFCIRSIHVFAFSTTVNILDIQLQFEDPSPEHVAEMLFHLKKVNEPIVSRVGEDSGFSLLGLAQSLMKEFDREDAFDYFFYQNDSELDIHKGKIDIWANYFLLVEAPDMNDYARNLFYLRNAYDDRYEYLNDPEKEQLEVRFSAPDTVWGITPLSAVCYVVKTLKNGHFIETVFARNFDQFYLFLYVYMLHQKYVMYMFLTKISSDAFRREPQRMSQYKRELESFETDFVYSVVAEVPQYQQFYEHIGKVYRLDELYEDVYEPARTMEEADRQRREDVKGRQESIMNRALALLAVLGIFSALVDSYDYIHELLSDLSQGRFAPVHLLQYGISAAILIFSVSILIGMLRSRWKQKREEAG